MAKAGTGGVGKKRELVDPFLQTRSLWKRLGGRVDQKVKNGRGESIKKHREETVQRVAESSCFPVLTFIYEI